MEYPNTARINTHRNHSWRTDVPPCDKHFQKPGHNLNAQAKFTIIGEVCIKSLSKLKILSLLEHREDFWVLKLQTLSHLIILKTVLDPFGSHFKTRFHTPFFHFILY